MHLISIQKNLLCVMFNAGEKRKASEDEIPEWAKPFLEMFKNQSTDQQAERNFNKETSYEFPYCSVCALFKSIIIEVRTSAFHISKCSLPVAV